MAGSGLGGMAGTRAQIFLAELAGTFLLVLAAAGVLVFGGAEVQHAALAPFLALVIGVYAFGGVSRAHFNPAVTLGYYITGHVNARTAALYVVAELAGSFCAVLLILALAGGGSDLGGNAPHPEYPAFVTVPVEALASFLLMAVILWVVYSGRRGLSGIAIGGMVGIDILLFSGISGASMNPARSLAPALLSGELDHLWLYLTVPFAGTAMAALVWRERFRSSRVQ